MSRNRRTSRQSSQTTQSGDQSSTSENPGLSPGVGTVERTGGETGGETPTLDQFAVEVSQGGGGYDRAGSGGGGGGGGAPSGGAPPVDSGSGGGAELTRLVHSYRRLVRRVDNAETTLASFETAADAENQRDEAESAAALRSQLTGDRAELDRVLGRIRELKGSAYADALVAKYGGEQEEDGGWELRRSAERELDTRGGGSQTEVRRTTIEDDDGTTRRGWETERSDVDAAVPSGSSPGGNAVRYELYQGPYADIYLDVAYLDFDGTLNGTLGQLAEMPELAMELRNAQGFGDVVRVLSQLDPSRFEMNGEIRAALDLLRATLTVEGAPAAIGIGGRDFLCEWMATLSARAYAEVYATGRVAPDLSDMNLDLFAEAGASALLEGSAEAGLNADWMGDSYGPLADVSVEGSVAAGAAAQIQGKLEVGLGVIEISGGTTLVWGAGGGVKGGLRVAVLPTLYLIADYLGIEAPSLPEPLGQIYESFKNNKDLVASLINAWDWLQEMRPLQILGDLLTSEEFWDLFDQLVSSGVGAIDIIGWLRDNYIQLDEEPAGLTFMGNRHESEFLWYAFAFGLDFLEWVQELGKSALQAVLPIMREVSRATLWVIINAGPWVVDLISGAWEGVKLAAEILGDTFGPVLQPLAETFVTLWTELGEPAVRWMLGLVGQGISWITEVIGTYGPPIVAFLQGLPAQVQAFFEEFTPQVVDALWRGGEWVVAALAELGSEMLGYLERWAPGVIELFTRAGQDIFNVITEYGGAVLGWCLQAGGQLLQLTGEQLRRIAPVIVDAAQQALDFMAELASTHLQPFLDLIDAQAGQLLRDLIAWASDKGASVMSTIAAVLPDFIAFAQRVGQPVWDLLNQLGDHLAPFLAIALDSGAEVLAWVSEQLAWLAPQIAEIGAAALTVLSEAGAFIRDIWDVGAPYLRRTFELVRDGVSATIDLMKEYGPPAIAWLGAVSSEAVALLASAGETALGHLILAGEWTRDLIVLIGEPLFPVLDRVGEALRNLGEQVGRDLIAAWQSYGAPVLEVFLQVGGEVWSAIGVGLSEILPIVDRFARDGLNDAAAFLSRLLSDHVGPAAQMLLALSSDALSELYTYALQNGPALAAEIGARLSSLVSMAADQMEQALLRMLEFGEWVLELGESATAPTLEVLEEYGPRYRERFRRYGDGLARLFVFLGDRAAELIERYGDPLIEAVIGLGQAIYDQTAEFVAWALPHIVEVGAFLWDSLVSFGESVVDALNTWVTPAILAAWESIGEPAIRLCLEIGEATLDLVTEYGMAAFELARDAGEALWSFTRTQVPILLDRLLAAEEQARLAALAVGREGLRLAAEAADAVWDQIKVGWETVGRPAVDFCIWVGEGIAGVLQAVGERLWPYVQRGARAAYWLYTEYAAPGLARLVGLAESVGSWLWARYAQQKREQIDLILQTSAQCLRALQGWAETAWEAAVALGEGLQRAWQQYGAPIIEAIGVAGRAVVEVYQTYAAPVVQWALDGMSALGAQAWQVARTVGAEVLEITRVVGTAVYGFFRDLAIAEWNRFVAAGEQVWRFAERSGAWVLQQFQTYGPKILDATRRLTEDAVAALGELAAAQVRSLLDGGERVLDALEEGGRALILLVRTAPELPRLLRERGAEAGRLALRHGAAFVTAIAAAPGAVFDLVVERGDALAQHIVRGGAAVVDALATHGRAAADLFVSAGSWFVDLVVQYGIAVVDWSIRLGSTFVSALRSGASWALSYIM